MGPATAVAAEEEALKPEIESHVETLKGHYPHWEKTKDIIDQLIDIILNYRQSGHPGGSRSKVYALLVTMLSGAMRWDIRNPTERFADRFILGAGHTIPLIYCTLAVLNEAMRVKHSQTGEACYAIRDAEQRALFWEDLLGFRRRGGLSGHAEMEGKTLFLKFNTGPSGHGSPASVGEALAVKRSGADGVKVFIFEGEGGLTPGATHETANSAWGLALDNLYYVLDWNDYGIDAHPVSDVVSGTPNDWFGSHGWRVFGTQDGEDWAAITGALMEMTETKNPEKAPSVMWFKSRKGRGYLKYDNASHGAPHAMNSEQFWQTKQPFADKYGARFQNFGGEAPGDPKALGEEFKANLEAVIAVLRSDDKLVDYLAERLVKIGDSVPQDIPTFCLGKQGNPFTDQRLYDFRKYPADMYAQPGEKLANRAALAKWGAWANTFGAKEYDRPLFIASSADLAGSTNISGFAEGRDGFKGYGWYERTGDAQGTLLPQTITEFTNAGIMVGLASVNLAADPNKEFDGFWATTSTYGSFSYLLYGMIRLFSQMTQDCQLKLGKVLWIAGHSGPETADDSRTHFGIFSPGVTQLLPRGKIINLHPWEYNEVPVLIAAGLQQNAPVVALHLTRPPVEIPDRASLGMPSHFEAARGAYVLHDYADTQNRGGTFIVQGTSAVANVIKLLPELDRRGLNVKIVCATSPQLFSLQSEGYRNSVLAPGDRVNSTIITTQARWLMNDWLLNSEAAEYALSADWDDNWRSGGTLDEVLDEARLSPDWILKGIERFVEDKSARLRRLAAQLEEAGR